MTKGLQQIRSVSCRQFALALRDEKLLTFLDDGEELVRAGVLEAGAGLEVLGEADDASDVQGDTQRHIVHVQLSARRHARHVVNNLVQHLEDVWEAPPAAASNLCCVISCAPLSQSWTSNASTDFQYLKQVYSNNPQSMTRSRLSDALKMFICQPIHPVTEDAQCICV